MIMIRIMGVRTVMMMRTWLFIMIPVEGERNLDPK